MSGKRKYETNSFSPETRAEIVAEYRAGTPSDVLAKKYKCGTGYIRGLASLTKKREENARQDQ